MGNTSSLRKAMLRDDVAMVTAILEEAGDGASDLINEDQTSDCLWNCFPNSQSPLHTAISRGKNKIAHVFIQYGADVNDFGLWGQTPLHQAAKWNNLEGFQLLVEHGADVKSKDADGKSILHAASISPIRKGEDSTQCLKYIVEIYGVDLDINAGDNMGRSPLHDAARLGNYPAVEYLLSVGADKTAANNNGATPLDEAQMFKRHDKVIAYLTGNPLKVD